MVTVAIQAADVQSAKKLDEVASKLAKLYTHPKHGWIAAIAGIYNKVDRKIENGRIAFSVNNLQIAPVFQKLGKGND